MLGIYLNVIFHSLDAYSFGKLIVIGDPNGIKRYALIGDLGKIKEVKTVRVGAPSEKNVILPFGIIRARKRFFKAYFSMDILPVSLNIGDRNILLHAR